MASAQRKPRSKTTSRGGSGRSAKAAEKAKPTPIRVLVVDDNQKDVTRIERCLGQMVSYKAAVDHAASLAETQSAIEAKKFDVALVDFHLGRETGTRVMRELGGRTGDIAFIFLTDEQGGDIKHRALEAGAFHLVAKKDISPDVLDNAIHSSLHTQKIESKLNDALVDLERATRARSDFFAKIGHDLKTPLNSVIGYSDAIAEETFGPIDNPKYREYAQAAREAGTHLLELIDNLIHFSIGDHQEVAFSPADLNVLVSSAMKMTELACRKRGHTLTKKLAPSPVLVPCQASAITQAIINLLTNAIKYSGGRGKNRGVGRRDRPPRRSDHKRHRYRHVRSGRIGGAAAFRARATPRRYRSGGNRARLAYRSRGYGPPQGTA